MYLSRLIIEFVTGSNRNISFDLNSSELMAENHQGKDIET